MSNGSFEQVYDTVRNEEMRSKEVLVKFEQDYPDVTTHENVDSILETLKRKEESKISLLEQLKQQELKNLR